MGKVRIEVVVRNSKFLENMHFENIQSRWKCHLVRKNQGINLSIDSGESEIAQITLLAKIAIGHCFKAARV